MLSYVLLNTLHVLLTSNSHTLNYQEYLHSVQSEYTFIEVKVVACNVPKYKVSMANGYLLIVPLELLLLFFFCHI